MVGRTTPRNRGFTLAELLVSAMMLSIVMTAVYTLFYSSVNAWRGIEREFDIYREARLAVATFRREVGNIVSQASHLFEGEDDEITMFVVGNTMDIDDSEGPHLMRVRYYYDRSDRELVREEALVETALPKAPPWNQDLDRERIKVGRRKKFNIAANVYDFEIAYIWLIAPKQRDPHVPPEPLERMVFPRHKERWGLPQGIRVSFTVRDPEGRSDPLPVEMTVPIRTPGMIRDARTLQGMLDSAS